MTLPVADFLQRWLLHVPMPQTRVVRSYGLYHSTQTAGLALCRAALGQPPVVVPVGLDWQTVCAQRGEAHPERCPTCGQLLVCTGVIPRGGAPPHLRVLKHINHDSQDQHGLPVRWCCETITPIFRRAPCWSRAMIPAVLSSYKRYPW
jgi:hypothetical protein